MSNTEALTKKATKLIQACHAGDVVAVRNFLKDPNINVNHRNQHGRTALMSAVAQGHLDVAQLLVDDPRVDVNLDDKYKSTVLIWAISSGDLEMVRVLLKNPKIDLDHPDQYGITALFWAIKKSHTDIVKTLLASEIDVIKAYIKNPEVNGDTHIIFAKVKNIIPALSFAYVNSNHELLAELFAIPAIKFYLAEIVCKEKDVDLRPTMLAMLMKYMPEDFANFYADTLFAHVSNDEINFGGTAGSFTFVFCEYLLKLQAHLINNAPAQAELLHGMSDQLSLIVQTDLTLKLYTDAIDIIKKELQHKRHVTLQSGWDWHSVIAELQYDASGDIILKLHNAGDGIQFHAHKKDTKGVRRYASALVYKVPGKNLKDPEIVRLIKTLIDHAHASTNPKQNFNNKDYVKARNNFYAQLADTMQHLNATKEDPDDYQISYIIGQRGGSCAWKSLMVFVKNSIHDNRQYLALKYEIKLKNLSDYYELQKTNARLPIVKKQILFACNNLERLLKKLDKIDQNNTVPPLVSMQRKALGSKTIDEIRSAFLPLKSKSGKLR